MNKKHKGKIAYALHAISIIPLIFSGLAIMLFGSHWITQIMHGQVAQELENIAQSTITLFNTAYPGEYELIDAGENGYRIHKGEQDITTEYSLVDQIKADTGMDVTLFYQDTRILTTIYASNGKRIVGTGAPSQVMKDVFETGQSQFYDNVIINGAPYFSYYAPLFNSDGSITGMLFIGKPCDNVEKAVQAAVYPLVFLVFITMLVTVVCLFFYTRNVVRVLLKIRTFLTNVSTGNMTTTLDQTVLQRNDELGDIGRCAVSMQNSLRTMVEQDALTGLFNRRCVNRKLKQMVTRGNNQSNTFSVAIGDIDFFKKINDTYGHEAGDIVLKSVASLLQEHMANCGFVARWGGEEFLFVFDHMDLPAARDSLERLLEQVRAMECNYNGHIIKVTMTIGLASENTEDINAILRKADERLYFGKTNGRNQVVI